jgi:hypothetical protein
MSVLARTYFQMLLKNEKMILIAKSKDRRNLRNRLIEEFKSTLASFITIKAMI